MPNVFNKYRSGLPQDAVYIGRPGKWGNPFAVGVDGSREEVISRFANWVLSQPALIAEIKRELAGKDLVCFCSPAPCHGDVLLAIANDRPVAAIELSQGSLF